MINYNIVQQIYNRNYGSMQLFKRPFFNQLVYTEGVKDFQQTLNAYWVVDNVISYMPEADVDTNFESMKEAIGNVKTGQVTYAVRDTHIDDKEIHEGDIMGIGDAGILSVGQSVEGTAKEMLAQLVDDDSELISLYYGQDVLAEDAEKFAQDVEALYPDVDVDVHMGGQPIYYYVLSVE